MTQEYTPVAWQDETTSQQGTLINAERLNQMQTAHHFADGLEEVDAVPTADPGVSYHKIVYCTADSTIYRWDGTEWTKDIDDETKALLQQEIARATEAEGELAQDLADEATARETADTALGNRITAEATARADADTALGGRIDTEQARAEAAEQANAQAIANTYTKAEIDTALGAKASTSTVQTLDTRVGALETGLADTYNKSQTDTLLVTKLDTLSTTGLHAYTHNGATQSEVSVINGTTASTIPIRDANGRMQAADPASGATDKTLVTANWISQTGNSAPNNVMHRYGAETIYGAKKADSAINGFLSNSTTDNNGDGTSGRYKVILKFPLDESYGSRNHILFGVTTRQRARSFDLLSLYIATRTPQDLTMVIRTNTENYTYVLSYDSDFGYVSIITNNSLSDSIQTLIIGGTQELYNRFPLCTAADIFDSAPGTEIRRLTP